MRAKLGDFDVPKRAARNFGLSSVELGKTSGLVVIVKEIKNLAVVADTL